MTTKTEIAKLIADRKEAGKTFAQIRDLLIALDHAESKTQAEKILLENGVDKKSGNNFTSKFREFIVANPTASKAEAYEFIKANSTDKQLDTKSHVNYFLNIASLANEIAKKHF